MNKRRRYRAVLVLGTVCLLIVGAGGLWLRSARRQEALNRQLIAALVKCDIKQAFVLLNSGADPNTPYKPTSPPSLHELCNRLLHRSPMLTPSDDTALCMACGACWLDEKGGATHMSDSEFPQLVQSMLQHGAKVNVGYTSGWTPLMYAIIFDRPKTVEVLLKHGADPNLSLPDGFTPLQLAKRNAPIACLLLLQQAGARK